MLATSAAPAGLSEKKPRCSASSASVVRDTILVIEDEDHVATLLTCVLERAKFKVLRASDGASGLRLFFSYEASIALVVLDCTLPDTNGGQLCRELRAAAAELPVLFVSGRDVSKLQNAFAGEGAMGFLPKPFFPSDVVRNARALIGATD